MGSRAIAGRHHGWCHVLQPRLLENPPLVDGLPVGNGLPPWLPATAVPVSVISPSGRPGAGIQEMSITDNHFLTHQTNDGLDNSC